MQNYIYMQKYMGKYTNIHAKHNDVYIPWDSLTEVKLWSADHDESMGHFSSYVGLQNRA